MPEVLETFLKTLAADEAQDLYEQINTDPETFVMDLNDRLLEIANG